MENIGSCNVLMSIQNSITQYFSIIRFYVTILINCISLFSHKYKLNDLIGKKSLFLQTLFIILLNTIFLFFVIYHFSYKLHTSNASNNL